MSQIIATSSNLDSVRARKSFFSDIDPKVCFWLILIILQQAYLLLSFDGTGDDGDSLRHFFHNHYAFKYPYMFVHLWAKPVLVACSCLFAQLGMVGMKLFNSICAISAGYLAYKYAKSLGYKNPELCIPLLMFMPRYLHHSLSALTEPLFSLMAIASLFLLKQDRKWMAALLISWLPFARPEGMFFIAAGLVYFLVQKDWKYIPVLATGHIVMSLAGALFFEQKLLWLFTNKPYMTLDHKYDTTGDWWHYILGLKELFGIPIFYLFWMGFGVVSISILLKLRKINTQYHKILMMAAIVSVIGAHTVFYKYGIMSTFGLLRIMLTISPLAAIVALVGLNSILKPLDFDSRLSHSLKYLTIAGIFVFLYSGNIYTFDFPGDFKLGAQQLQAREVAAYVRQELPDHRMTYYYYAHLDLELEQDPFDWRTHRLLNKSTMKHPISKNTVVIWDDWYARVDGRVDLSELENSDQLEFVKSFTTRGKWNQEKHLVVFKSRNWQH